MSDAATENGNVDNNNQVEGIKKEYKNTWHTIIIGVGMILLMIACLVTFFLQIHSKSRQQDISILRTCISR